MNFGERLRQQRLARGVDLAQIAEETRIGRRYLEALENGDHKIIPGSIFARSFARQYALHVGLDPLSIEDEIQAAFLQYPDEPLVPATPSKENRLALFQPDWKAAPRKSYWEQIPRPSLALVVALVACSVLYMGWQRVVLGRGTAGPVAGPETVTPVAGVPTTKLPTPEQLPKPGSLAERTVVQMAQGAATGSNEVQVPQVAGGGGMQIGIVASETTWVSIIANGKPVYSGVLQPNSSRVLRGVENARLVIGNAGGLQVTTDGRPIGPIGPLGEVRVLLLTPQGSQILRTADQKPAPVPTAEPKAADPNKVVL